MGPRSIRNGSVIDSADRRKSALVSQTTLAEAALCVPDADAVGEARDFVLSTADLVIDKETAEHLAAIEPRRTAFIHAQRKRRPAEYP